MIRIFGLLVIFCLGNFLADKYLFKEDTYHIVKNQIGIILIFMIFSVMNYYTSKWLAEDEKMNAEKEKNNKNKGCGGFQA
jgi:hypothetical protein